MPNINSIKNQIDDKVAEIYDMETRIEASLINIKELIDEHGNFNITLEKSYTEDILILNIRSKRDKNIHAEYFLDFSDHQTKFDITTSFDWNSDIYSENSNFQKQLMATNEIHVVGLGLKNFKGNNLKLLENINDFKNKLKIINGEKKVLQENYNENKKEIFQNDLDKMFNIGDEKICKELFEYATGMNSTNFITATSSDDINGNIYVNFDQHTVTCSMGESGRLTYLMNANRISKANIEKALKKAIITDDYIEQNFLFLNDIMEIPNTKGNLKCTAYLIDDFYNLIKKKNNKSDLKDLLSSKQSSENINKLKATGGKNSKLQLRGFS
jgi:hypothetical protein